MFSHLFVQFTHLDHAISRLKAEDIPADVCSWWLPCQHGSLCLNITGSQILRGINVCDRRHLVNSIKMSMY